MRLYAEDRATPMIGQVGGASIHKKPVLTLKPDYVLKPLLTDHRGLREVAFYEAVKVISNSKSCQAYASFLDDRMKTPHSLWLKLVDTIDTIALAFAMSFKDEVVVESEKALKKAWKKIKKEVDVLNKLVKLTPQYHGIMCQSVYDESFEYGVSESAHLLLHDLTINFSKPCVMDLKMGTHTFEPDATPEKIHKETSKYPQQTEFGFRIVGMRIYNPSHKDADHQGYAFYGKEFGRNLKTEDEVIDAFGLFFGSKITERGVDNSDSDFRSTAASKLLMQLKPLRKWFEENKSLRFCASSLLIVYEGDKQQESGSCDAVTVKMIDFGRVRRCYDGDNGYLSGLKKLSECVTELLERQSLEPQQ